MARVLAPLLLNLALVLWSGAATATATAPAATAPTATAPAAAAAAEPEIDPRLLRRFAPVRTRIDGPGGPPSSQQVQLGRQLYFDPRLSRGGDISCNTCHRLDRYGVDGLKTSVGYKGQRGKRNAPTVYHAAGYFQQMWDGREPDVESQAKGPIVNPAEMAMASGPAVVAVLRGIPGYVATFKAAFPAEAEPLTYDNVGRAIGAFERMLTTPSRWDAYLGGDKSALSAEEKRGVQLFISIGCMACHNGEMLGGGTALQKLGAAEPWPNQRDQGRFDITQIPLDKMFFKVPTLRNVEKTAPYFHDGSVTTLARAVWMMGKYQLGIELQPAETALLVGWLKSLTGALPEDLIAAPELPPALGARAPSGGGSPSDTGTAAVSRGLPARTSRR